MPPVKKKKAEQDPYARPGVGDILTVKRVVTTEEEYIIEDSYFPIRHEKIVNGLMTGEYNLVQHALLEDCVLLVNNNGKVVAKLKKEGGCGPDHEVGVEIR